MARVKAAEEMEMAVRDKQDACPIFLGISVALAISVAGFVTARRRSRSHRYSSPSAPHPHSCYSSGAKSRAIGELGLGLKEDLQILKGEKSQAKIVDGTSQRSKNSGNHEGFLLSELNDLVIKELGEGVEIITGSSMPKDSEVKDDKTMEQEIASLRNLVLYLQEKERNLELQLLEYHEMQEQEAAMRELESGSKTNSAAADTAFYSFEIESLQADNRRLLASLSECSRAVNELEDANVTIKFLRKKMRLDGEQAKEEPREEKNNEEIERKLQKLKELEVVTAEVKRSNSELAEENSDLARKLQESALEAADAVEQLKILKESDAKLMAEIEQLRMDRCAYAEELVDLKCVNTCLRNELRNYQPPPGKTIARDLSNRISLGSEEKAKQFIMENANASGDETKSVSSVDFEHECSSQLLSTAEHEDSAAADVVRTQHKNKKKFLSKVKQLVLGKDKSNSNTSKALTLAADKIPRNPTKAASWRIRASKSISSIEDISPCLREDLINSGNHPATAAEAQGDESEGYSSWWQSCPSSNTQTPRPSGACEEAQKESYGDCKRRDGRLVAGDDREGDVGGACNTLEKAELKKNACAVTKGGGGASKTKRRSASMESLFLEDY